MKKLTFSILSMFVFLFGFHRLSFAQSKILPDAETADQIHYTIISAKAMTFDWVGTANQIRFGTDSACLNNVVFAKHPDLLPVTSPWTSDPGPYWEAKLTGLKKNSVYFYAVGISGKEYKFRTPNLSGKSGFRVCLTSDMHETSAECRAMFSQIAELKPDLVLTTGDVTGAGPDGQQQVVNRFHDAMVWSQSAAWMPAWGNHDWEYTDKDDLRTLKGRFDIPHPGTISSSPAISCCGEDWGWFDYGNTRFISYPEPWTSSSWDEWSIQVIKVFTSAQNNPDIRFVITFGHRPSYASTLHRSPGDTQLRAILDRFHALFPKYILDLSGHNHQYERYHLASGMTYIVNSTTGSYYHEGWDNPTKPPDCIFRAIHYGILLLDFRDSSIEGRFICSVGTTQTGADYLPLEEHLCTEPGSVIDSFTINTP
jgi:predicted MPP superfamily phosphohydrolase